MRIKFIITDFKPAGSRKNARTINEEELILLINCAFDVNCTYLLERNTSDQIVSKSKYKISVNFGGKIRQNSENKCTTLKAIFFDKSSKGKIADVPKTAPKAPGN